MPVGGSGAQFWPMPRERNLSRDCGVAGHIFDQRLEPRHHDFAPQLHHGREFGVFGGEVAVDQAEATDALAGAGGGRIGLFDGAADQGGDFRCLDQIGRASCRERVCLAV